MSDIADLILSKGFEERAIDRLQMEGRLGAIVSQLVMGYGRGADIEQKINTIFCFPHGSASYKGSFEENERIRRAFYDAKRKEHDSLRPSFGPGYLLRYSHAVTMPRHCPIVILGGGASGILVTKALAAAGQPSEGIRVIDSDARYGGVWTDGDFASGLGMISPRHVNFFASTLDEGYGQGTAIADFLEEIAVGLPSPVQGEVTRVEPGDLEHTVTYRAQNGLQRIKAPIVINALGNGKPRPLSSKRVMVTPERKVHGRRQFVITDELAEAYRDKTLVFIGLGNSTAEMIKQVQERNKAYFNIQYRILTHFPKESIEKPRTAVCVNGRKYRVFRDLFHHDVTGYAGDRWQLREAYSAARNNIISDVCYWRRTESGIVVRRKNQTDVMEIAADYVYALIGTEHNATFFDTMGIRHQDGISLTDYDGEVQRDPGARGRNRLYPGYFALGGVNNSNPHSAVIPGIIYQVFELMAAMFIRSMEWDLRRCICTRSAATGTL